MKKCVMISLILIVSSVAIVEGEEIGILVIYNRVGDLNIQSHDCWLGQWDNDTVFEGFDLNDEIFEIYLWIPSGKSTKIVSIIPDYELMTDGRPIDTTTAVNLELSLISQSGVPITTATSNTLNFFWWVNMGGGRVNNEFRDKPITIQQYDPCDPSALHLVYDVRTIIAKNNGDLQLADLDGTYQSEEPYSYFRIRYDMSIADLDYNGIVDFKDYANFADKWLTDGHNLQDNWANRADLNGDGTVDPNDLGEFCDDWLWDANDPNTW